MLGCVLFGTMYPENFQVGGGLVELIRYSWDYAYADFGYCFDYSCGRNRTLR